MADLVCSPRSGTVPFTTRMTVTLANRYNEQVRRVASMIRVDLASGGTVANWRSGYQNIAGGETAEVSWQLTFPAMPSVIGENRFQLVAEDVTPAPYNQPPYPPSGDTDKDTCLVRAIAP